MGNRSWMRLAAGILDVVAGVSAIFGFLFIGFAAAIVSWAPTGTEDVPIDIVVAFLGGLGLFVLILGVLAIFGGALAIRGGRWGWALTGAIAATVVCPPLGVPAIILTVLAESDIRTPASVG